jgi:hypothetical protein
VRYKVDVVCQSDGRARIKITKHELVQKIWDEFDLPGEKTTQILTKPGQSLVKGDGGATMYCSGTALCMQKMKSSRPDIYNASWNSARHMSIPGATHTMTLKHW